MNCVLNRLNFIWRTTVRAIAIAALLLTSTHAVSAAEPMATERSVRQLLQVTQSRQLLDGMMGQMDSIMQASMEQAMGGQTPTAEQRAVMDDMRQKMVGLFQEEMKWEVLEPRFIELYRQTFTEQEVLGMLQFYRSPAGRAVIAKMPQVMQRSMTMVQEVVGGMMPRLQRLEAEAREKLRCCKDGRR